MRLFIAREALDPHLKVGAPVLDTRRALSDRLASGVHAAGFYARWYPTMYLRGGVPAAFDSRLRVQARWCAAASKRLGRRLFHQMLRYGPALEKQQLLLARFVEIGAELFAMSASIARAQQMITRGNGEAESAVGLALYFCKAARLRIEERFRHIGENVDLAGYRLARSLLGEVPAFLQSPLAKANNA
ncbi:MAG TPA: hypothetical protein VIM48_05525, partial [Chthoniobacterales bacterium]